MGKFLNPMLKNKSLLLLFLLYFITGLSVKGFALNITDSLTSNLDKVLSEKDVYVQKRLSEINKLKRELSFTDVGSQKYSDLLGELFELYKVFQLDSAMIIAEQRVGIVSSLNDVQSKMRATLNLAEAKSVTGMYKEAEELLSTVVYEDLDLTSKIYYFHLNHSLNTLMVNYSLSESDKRKYEKTVYQYKDSLLKYTPQTDPVYHMILSTKYLMLGKNDEAYDVAISCFNDMKANGWNTAIITHILSEIFEAKEDYDRQEIYLLKSAIDDVYDGKKEYISLRRLSVLKYEKGDIARAYSYMKNSMEDAVYCSARLRALEISQLMPIISTAYDLKTKQEKRNLLVFSTTISILVIVLICAMLYIYKQLKAIAVVRLSLKNMNTDLMGMNDDLNNLNSVLSESNHVKEEYIGYLFSICSSYINKIEDFRKSINRKLKAGQIDDVVQLTNPTSTLLQTELKEFYKNFDTIFLNLYPDFVEQFNTLLVPGENILPKEGELLSPELRIFALVRLGINDSVKIANFLHYSPQTVYNYRLKVRNKSVLPKEQFPGAVAKISQLKV